MQLAQIFFQGMKPSIFNIWQFSNRQLVLNPGEQNYETTDIIKISENSDESYQVIPDGFLILNNSSTCTLVEDIDHQKNKKFVTVSIIGDGLLRINSKESDFKILLKRGRMKKEVIIIFKFNKKDKIQFTLSACDESKTFTLGWNEKKQSIYIKKVGIIKLFFSRLLTLLSG